MKNKNENIPVWLILEKDVEIPFDLPKELVMRADEKGRIKPYKKYMLEQAIRIVTRLYDSKNKLVYFKTWKGEVKK